MESEAYALDGLVTRRFGLDGDVTAEVPDAEASIAQLNVSGASLFNSAAALIGRTYPGANDAVSQLVAAGVLRQVNLGRRNRAHEAPEIIAASTDPERQFACPEGDTRTSEPMRRAPLRRIW